jgi:hypothetical protein
MGSYFIRAGAETRAVTERACARLPAVLLFAAVLGGPSLARAQDIDACIDASEKALSQRKAEKLIDARASLSKCAASTCPDAVSASCRQRLADVIRAIPGIVFVTRDGSGADLAAVKLSIDGAVYADRLDGRVIELDPGEHDFRFEVAGQAPVAQRFVLHEGERNRREIVVIGGVSTAPAAGQTESPAAVAEPKPSSQTDGGGQRTAALVVAGVGVAGLITGGVFGGLSMSAHNTYELNCGSNIGAPPGQCNAQGVSGESDAATKGTIATALLIGGGVLTAAGAAWYFLAPSGPKSVQVGVGLGAITLRGEF